MEKTRNASLDMARTAAAFAVVLIHCSLGCTAGRLLTDLARAGVPLFFLISGYCFYREEAQARRTAAKRLVLRNAGLLLAAEGFYFLWNLLLYVRKFGFRPAILPQMLSAVTAGYDPRLLLITWPVFFNAGWFLGQLILACLVWQLLLRFCPGRLAALLTAAGMLVGCRSALLMQFPYPEYLAVFMSIPWFGAGCLLKAHRDWVDRMPVWLIPVGLLLILPEKVLLGSSRMYWGTCLVVLSLAAACIRQSDRAPATAAGHRLARIGQRDSRWIYILHPWVLNLLGFVGDRFPAPRLWGLLLPILACAVSACAAALLSVCLVRLRKTEYT